MKVKNNGEIKRDKEIEKIYAHNFDKVEATPEFQKKVKEAVDMRANMRIRNRQIVKSVVAIAACFIMVIGIANGNKIIAAVNNIYQMYVGNLNHQFENNANGYEIDINKTFAIKEGLDMKIEKVVVLNDSLDIKYSLNNKEKQTDENFATIAECTLKTDKEDYVLDQEMNSLTEKAYLTALGFSDEKKNLSACKGKRVDVEATVFYGNDGKEKKIRFSMDVKDVYQTKVYDLSSEKISVNGVKIDSIQKKLWYMKVEYSFDNMSTYSEGPILIFENNKEDLLWLGGGVNSGYEVDDNQGSDEIVNQELKNAKGTEYVQLDDDAEHFKVYYATLKQGKIEKDEMFYQKSDKYVTIDLSDKGAN